MRSIISGKVGDELRENRKEGEEGGLPDEFGRRLHFVDVSGGGC